MVDLTTRWMGLTLQSPVIVGAGPVSQDPDAAREAARAGLAWLPLGQVERDFVLQQGEKAAA